LLVLRGPDHGRSLHLTKEEVVIGSGAGADLQLTDPAVSRLHASLTATESGFLLTDLDSTNGTMVGTQRIKAAYVEFGDAIEIGSTRLRIEETRKSVDLALSSGDSFGPLVGRSAAARRLFAVLEAVAKEDTTVLLLGETGVGKDTCAEALHGASRRVDKPFVVVDCAALAEGVIESELFGHIKGAFTGAHESRDGAFVEADTGTLFIDEIGDLPRHLQPKLLRALETREVRPVGAAQPVKFDVRIIAATNRDLKIEVNQGTFREDLFYRLNVISVHVPPLRERMEDIPLLANLFWKRITRDPEGSCPPELLRTLVTRRWPGNIRELLNRIEEAALLQRTEVGSLERPAVRSYREARRDALNAFEHLFLTELLERARGNVAEAARLASMDRVYLTKLLTRQGLRRRSS
jgi:transcriptional regulator with GAF, ATPase, and Fis domain